jgi:hypothetical protein
MSKHLSLILIGGVLIIVIVIIGGVVLRQKLNSILSAQPTLIQSSPSPTPTVIPAKVINQTLFVPYWSMGTGELLPEYQKLIYFGLQVTPTGIDRDDQGYTSLRTFVKESGGQDKILAIRMIDSKTNFEILKDAKSQDIIMEQSIQEAKAYGFRGLLLNLEVSALPFGSLVDQITVFNERFAVKTRKAGLGYSLTAYGDTFYRLRPFDMAKLAKQVDLVYVMAYDFHKAKGNPGPNFPLGGKDIYGYDYRRMIDNFTDAVPAEKLSVVFGMYGYDWSVDDSGVASEIGEPMALKDVKATIINHCAYLSCEWERDSLSAETKATYSDKLTGKHIVWFEDEESVKRKQEFLKSRGIGSYAYWAHSYF